MRKIIFSWITILVVISTIGCDEKRSSSIGIKQVWEEKSEEGYIGIKEGTKEAALEVFKHDPETNWIFPLEILDFSSKEFSNENSIIGNISGWDYDFIVERKDGTLYFLSLEVLLDGRRTGNVQKITYSYDDLKNYLEREPKPNVTTEEELKTWYNSVHYEWQKEGYKVFGQTWKIR